MMHHHTRALLLFLIVGLAFPDVWAVDPLVDLTTSKVQGVAQEDGTTRWLGIRYAAPPLGNLRFAAPMDPPPTGDTVIDASSFRPICLPNNPNDYTMQPNRRFTVSEDCLYLNIFAPSNATRCSKLPVMYFVQGGGFGSNSNANFNGSALAAFGNMIVVQVNYRVGPFGFAQSQEIIDHGSLNNGLKDIIQGNKWLKQNIGAFGGDPDHIVIQGVSAGAAAIALILAGIGSHSTHADLTLFKGAILESPSVSTVRRLDQGQEQYDCLIKAAGCDSVSDSLACLRSRDASKLQTPNCQFNPHIDDDLVKQPSLSSFANGQFLRVPTIMGTCLDDGTKSVDSSVNTVARALEIANNTAFGALTIQAGSLINKTYIQKPQPIFPNKGVFWRQIANAHRDYRQVCILQRLQNALAAAQVPVYSYLYAVKDPEQEALGFGAYHAVELNGIFGPNNTDGSPPSSYRTTNAPIVPITMAYWASFVRSLNPNSGRLHDAPEWLPWVGGPGGRNWLRFETGAMAMEAMPDWQVANCEMLDPMLPAIETPSTPNSIHLVEAPGTDDPPGTGAVPVSNQ